MRTKIGVVLAGLAATAIWALLASGAGAEEEEFELVNWKMGGETYTKEFEFSLDGTEKWGSTKPELECVVHKKVTANKPNASSTGVTHVEVTMNTCAGVKGTRYEKCEVESLGNTTAGTYTEEFHLTKTKKSGKLETVWTKDNTKFVFKGPGNCNGAEIEFFFPTVAGVPANPTSISTETVSAVGEELDSEHEGPIAAMEEGSLSVSGEIEGKSASGTMGIG